MILSKTALVVIVCSLFLFVLLVFSYFDLAISLSLAVYFILAKTNYIFIFLVSLILFILDYIFKYFDLNINLVSDFSIDAYILFITAVILYLKSQKDFQNLADSLKINEKDIFSWKSLRSIIICLVFTLLLIPISGRYFAIIIGSILFSFFTKQINGKIAMLLAGASLLIVVIFLLLNRPDIAGEFGIYTYLLLTIGIFQEVIFSTKLANLLIWRGQRKTEKKKIPGPENRSDTEDQFSTVLSENMTLMSDKGYSRLNIRRSKNLNDIILSCVIVIAVIASGFYYKSRLSALNFKSLLSKFTIPKIEVSKKENILITPTITVMSTSVASIALISTPTADSGIYKMKILIQNGTDINGLASSSATKLKEAGFTNVKIGNASKQDYLKWEIISKKQNNDLLYNIKKILEISNLSSKEASPPSGFDVLLIAGKSN